MRKNPFLPCCHLPPLPHFSASPNPSVKGFPKYISPSNAFPRGNVMDKHSQGIQKGQGLFKEERNSSTLVQRPSLTKVKPTQSQGCSIHPFTYPIPCT